MKIKDLKKVCEILENEGLADDWVEAGHDIVYLTYSLPNSIDKLKELGCEYDLDDGLYIYT